MKSKLNDIAPRQATKRALALSLEVIESLKAMFKEFNATDISAKDSYPSSGRVFNFLVPTIFGNYEVGVHKRDIEADNVDAVLGIYGIFDMTGTEPQIASLLGGNQYSHKWNHYVKLTAVEVANLLAYLRGRLTKLQDLTGASEIEVARYEAAVANNKLFTLTPAPEVWTVGV